MMHRVSLKLRVFASGCECVCVCLGSVHTELRDFRRVTTVGKKQLRYLLVFVWRLL